MKKRFLLVFVTIYCAITACGQKKLSNADVPEVVKSSFAKQYPRTIAKWEKEDGRYEAEFKKNGKEMSAVFEDNGTMRESEIEIDKSSLSAEIRNYIRAHYNNAAIKEASKITLSDGKIEYEAAIRGKDILFDEKGKFVKEVKH